MLGGGEAEKAVQGATPATAVVAYMIDPCIADSLN